MRAAQRFNAVQVEEVEVGREQRQRDHGFVEIDADLFLDARLVANDLTGGNAAQSDLALSRPEVLDRQTGDVAREVFEVLRTRPLNVFFGLRIDGERHILKGLRPLRRGYDDFV